MDDRAGTAFGEELRRYREAREVTLASIASGTKISMRYLEALEAGDFARLPAPVFTRGFIRSYAVCLGVEPDELVNAYIAATGHAPSDDVPKAKNRSARPGSPATFVVGALVLAVALLAAAGLWIRQRRGTARRAGPAHTETVTPPHVRVVAAGAPTTSPAPAPPVEVSASAEPAPATPVAGGIALRVAADGDCWVRISRDGEIAYEGLLRKGESRRYLAQTGFRVTLGDASAARLTVNGHDLPVLGRAGEVVRDFVIDASHLREILSARG
jgi:cytoskeleton protein RodZ